MTQPVESPVGPDYLQLGERIRAARHRHGLSLRELAARLGVSPSMISQIETGRASPSVSTLYAIASELDISLDEVLFNDRRQGRPDSGSRAKFQPADSRKRIRLASGVTWERLTPVSEPDTEFLHVVYEVGGASSAESAFQRHAGHEWGYVLEGSLDVRIGFEDYVLDPGDAISFDSTIPHRLANAGDVPVHAIWFVHGRTPGGTDGGDDLHSHGRTTDGREPRRR